eukprot:5718505-Pleurochrysis_carterae.AAC.2
MAPPSVAPEVIGARRGRWRSGQKQRGSRDPSAPSSPTSGGAASLQRRRGRACRSCARPAGR